MDAALAPVAAVGRDRKGLGAHDLAPNTADEAEAIVGEAVAAGLQPLVASGTDDEVVARFDRPHRSLEQRDVSITAHELVACDLAGSPGIGAAGPG